MNRKIVSFLFIVYILLGLAGFFYLGSCAYYEADSFNRYLGAELVPRILIAIVFGLLFLKYYQKAYPELYEKRKNRFGFKVFIPILFSLLALLINIGLLLPYNSLFGYDRKIEVKGIVMNKDIRRGSKGKLNYYVSISDTITTQNYFFHVKRKVYEDLQRNNKIDKEFYVGKLGILYRNEE